MSYPVTEIDVKRIVDHSVSNDERLPIAQVYALARTDAVGRTSSSDIETIDYVLREYHVRDGYIMPEWQASNADAAERAWQRRRNQRSLEISIYGESAPLSRIGQVVWEFRDGWNIHIIDGALNHAPRWVRLAAEAAWPDNGGLQVVRVRVDGRVYLDLSPDYMDVPCPAAPGIDVIRNSTFDVEFSL